MQRPLATVVIGGVASSTILTLLVLPALYLLVTRRNALIERKSTLGPADVPAHDLPDVVGE
jgi:heavy metal efflux system protein